MDGVWYAFRVPSQKESVAAELIKRRGFTSFVPTETKWRRINRYSRRKASFEYPILISYVLVQFERGPVPWGEIFKLGVVKSVVGFDGKPAPISQRAIERLMAISGQTLLHARTVNPHRGIQVGGHAQIAIGPFRDSIVKVEEIIGKKAKVLLECFGTIQEISIPLEGLEAA